MIRWILAEILYACQSVGYWIRPYDMLADNRRWLWQRRYPCARYNPHARALARHLNTLQPKGINVLGTLAAQRKRTTR